MMMMMMMRAMMAMMTMIAMIAMAMVAMMMAMMMAMILMKNDVDDVDDDDDDDDDDEKHAHRMFPACDISCFAAGAADGVARAGARGAARTSGNRAPADEEQVGGQPRCLEGLPKRPGLQVCPLESRVEQPFSIALH